MSLRVQFPRLLHTLHNAPSPVAHSILPRLSPVAASRSAARQFSSAVVRPRPFTQSPKATPFTSFLRHRFGHAVRNATTYARADESAPVDWTAVATRVGLAVVAGFGLNYALNRETRGGLSAYEADYLNTTFMWTGAGLVITAAVAKGLHSSGFALRMMQANKWAVIGVSLVASIGSMMGVYYTPPDSPLHYLSWAVFSATQGAVLAPMFYLNPAILARAGLYTAGAVAGLSYVGATAQSEQFMYLGGALMCGLGVLLAASLAPMILPRMSMRTMSLLEHGTAYGGVALFSGFLLYDTQKILAHANLAQRGAIPRDPIRESVSLILDAINLFVRIVQVMMLQQRKK